MKKTLLFLAIIACLQKNCISQELYSSATPVSRFNPGFGNDSTPIIAFDDINIPTTKVAEGSAVNVKKIKVGIRRLANAPATKVSLYYTSFDDTSTTPDTHISIPPVLIGTVNLPANGSAPATSIVSLGDSVSTLFTVKTTSVYSNYQSFFLGVSLDKSSNDNGISLTSGQGYNVDAIWLYNTDDARKRYAGTLRNNLKATFNFQVFGAQQSSFPVTLSSFTGERKEAANLLRWVTETELNNKHFEIQRSVDGSNFTAIGSVASNTSNGSSSTQKHYEFVDAKHFAGNNYYRLKQLDKDGKTMISSVVLIKREKASSIVLSGTYPNPATTDIHLVAAVPANDNLQFVITDLSGRAVLKFFRAVVAGNNNLSFNVGGLAAGEYFLKTVSTKNGETQATKFVKQ